MFFNRSKLSRYGIVEEENDMIKVHVKKNIVYNHKILLPVSKNGKKVRYLFNDINFGDETVIDGSNCDLFFNNCSFTQSLKVSNANNIQMENNKYVFYSFANNFIELTANEIVVKDNNFTNISFAKKIDEPTVNISLIGSSINIENSVICSEYGGNIKIMTKNLSMRETTINSPHILYINADHISTKNSVIKASKEIKIDNSNCSFTCAVKSPVTIYNNIKLNTTNSEIIDLNKDSLELLKARMQLLNTLHKVEINCNRKNDDTLTDMQRKLNERKITKVLKKGK